MAVVFAQERIPASAWFLGSMPDEANSVLVLATAITVSYSSGSPDTLPALTPAAVTGGASATTFDRTTATWVAYTVQGSGVLSLIKESDIGSIGGTYAILARVIRHHVTEWQQA